MGTSSATLSEAAKKLNSPDELSRTLYTGMHFRYYFALLASLILGPVMLWLLIKSHAGISLAMLLTFIVLSEFYINLKTEFFQITLRLFSIPQECQKADFLARLLKLFLTFFGFFVRLNAFLGLLFSLISTWFKAERLQSRSESFVKIAGPVDKAFGKIIRTISIQMAPNSIFYCLQSQISVVVLSFFGNTANIAEIGAIGRFAVVFRLFNEVIANYVAPFFAKIQDNFSLRKFFKLVLLTCLFSNIVIITLAFSFSHLLLRLLGTDYLHLKNELVLLLSGAMLHSTAGIFWQMMLAKSWTSMIWLNPVLIIAAQITACFLIDLSTVNGAIWLNIVSCLPGFLITIITIHKKTGGQPEENAQE